MTSLIAFIRRGLAPHFVTRVEFGRKGPWGRGTLRVRWRSINEAAPIFFRLHRRNPVDHKVVRLRRVEVWW